MTRPILKPKPLAPGSTVMVVSLSSGLPARFPGIYELGLRNLREELGLTVIESTTARMTTQELYHHPRLRAEQLMAAFADPSVDGVISSIGGYESIRLLPHLEPQVFLDHPKLYMGFSDTTATMAWLNQLGLVTFYGPSVMAGLAQLKHLPEAFRNHLRDILFGSGGSAFTPYRYRPYSHWSDGYLDWSDPGVLGQLTPAHPSPGWCWLQGASAREGRLWGGCIEVLEFLKGTAWWPERPMPGQPSFWDDRILFFETSEEKPTPDQVGYMLRNYGMQGILNRVAGLVFGRPKDYSEAESAELVRIIRSILGEEFEAREIPVVFGFDAGHTDPKAVLPMNTMLRLDPQAGEILLVESPFRE